MVNTGTGVNFLIHVATLSDIFVTYLFCMAKFNEYLYSCLIVVTMCYCNTIGSNLDRFLPIKKFVK